MPFEFEGLIFGGAYNWRGLFSEFYDITDDDVTDTQRANVKCAIFLKKVFQQAFDKSESKASPTFNTHHHHHPSLKHLATMLIT